VAFEKQISGERLKLKPYESRAVEVGRSSEGTT
jgi:hypothetical protein